MIKRIFVFLMILVICLGGGTSVLAAEAVCLDMRVSCGDYITEFNGFMVDGYTCLRLQDLSAALNGSVSRFSVSIDTDNLTAVIEKRSPAAGEALFKRDYSAAPPVEEVSLEISCDGEEIAAEAFLIDGEIFCELRSVCGLLGFEPLWNGDKKTVELYSNGGLTAEIFCERSKLKLSGKPVCFTFDDGPSYASTKRYLNALSAAGGHGTFFVVGERVDGYSELIKAIYEQGSQLGNHSYSHALLTGLSKDDAARELNLTSNAVYDVCGTYTYIARPPYGALNSVVKSAVNVPFFNWSIDTLDWKYRDADYIYNYIMNNVKEGDVVLMHDLYETSAEAFERAVPELAAQGYVFVSIEEMAQIKGGYDKVKGYLNNSY